MVLNLHSLKVLHSYAHMMPADEELWTRFIETYQIPNAAVAYDVHVGTPTVYPGKLADNWTRMINVLSRKRIDAVILTPHGTTLYEVKPYAGITAIGQVLCYLPLFQHDYPEYKPLYGAILTDHAQNDTRELCELHAIHLIELD